MRSGPDHAAVTRLTTEALESWLAAVEADPLSPTYRWALTPPGKLLRPALLLWSAGAVGGSTDVVLPAAVGVELVHVGSLVHDDIIDADAVRRGKPSVPREFGTERAVLAGDALFFALFETLTDCQRSGASADAVVTAVRLFARAGRQLTSGVARELAFDPGSLAQASNDTLVADYLETARLKTAALLRVACQAGAVLGGGSGAEAAVLAEYGEALGIAFQIRDDLLPYLAVGRGAGKSADSDLRNGRPCLPVLLAHAMGGPAGRAQLARILESDAPPARRTDWLRDLVAETGALKEAHRMVEEQAHRCHEALRGLTPSPDRQRLTRLLVRVTDLAEPWARPVEEQR